MHEPDYKNLIAFLKAMEFNTITRRVAEKAEIDASAGRGRCEADVERTPPEPAPSADRAMRTGDLFPASTRRKPNRSAKTRQAPSPRFRSPPRAPEAARNQKIDRSKYECVRTLARLKEWIARAHDVGVVAVDTETTSLDADAGGPVRLFARAIAERGLLRAARAQEGRRRRRPVRRRSKLAARPDPGSTTR